MNTLDYQTQADEFLKSVGATIKIEFLDYDKYFDDDKEMRNIYRFTLRRAGKSYTGKFGDSVQSTRKGEEPIAYDILSCLTKNDPSTFESFCNEFDYDTDSRKAERTYKAVIREWKGVERVFGDVLEKLQEIQ